MRTDSRDPREETAAGRGRRTANLLPVRAGMAALSWYQRAHGPRQERSPGRPRPGDASWTTARVLAANLIVLCVLGAVVVLVSGLLGGLGRQGYFVVFSLLTVSLIRRGCGPEGLEGLEGLEGPRRLEGLEAVRR